MGLLGKYTYKNVLTNFREFGLLLIYSANFLSFTVLIADIAGPVTSSLALHRVVLIRYVILIGRYGI